MRTQAEASSWRPGTGQYRRVGLQFHPESILTPQGPALLKAVTAGLARTP